jgi:imidazole glycerol-phosphate synthase subunit HisH
VRDGSPHGEEVAEYEGLAVTIALIDYGAGNLTSVKKAFAAIGAELFVPRTPAELADASAVVVPGVGHFDATRALVGAWTDAILERVGEGRPLLGICLGMHWLFEASEEAPGVPGLGVLGGTIARLKNVRLKPDATLPGDVRLQPDVKIPHVGWNSLSLCRDASIVSGIESGAQVYFSHSYAAPITSETIAVTDHGAPFAAVVQRGQIAGVQFHPEKSGDAGLRILRNFVELAR